MSTCLNSELLLVPNIMNVVACTRAVPPVIDPNNPPPPSGGPCNINVLNRNPIIVRNFRASRWLTTVVTPNYGGRLNQPVFYDYSDTGSPVGNIVAAPQFSNSGYGGTSHCSVPANFPWPNVVVFGTAYHRDQNNSIYGVESFSVSCTYRRLGDGTCSWLGDGGGAIAYAFLPTPPPPLGWRLDQYIVGHSAIENCTLTNFSQDPVSGVLSFDITGTMPGKPPRFYNWPGPGFFGQLFWYEQVTSCPKNTISGAFRVRVQRA